MNYRNGVLSGVIGTVLIALATWWLAIPRTPEQKAAATVPAKIPKPLKEEQVNAMTITAEAEKHLAMRSGKVTRKPVRRSRVYGGEAIVPPGQSIIVSAPLNGMLRMSPGKPFLAGQVVTKGQPVAELLPLLTPEGRANLAASAIDADGQVKNARESLDAADIVLKRAERLFKGEAGSRRAVDDAQAVYNLARKTLDAAIARDVLLKKVAGDAEAGRAAPIMVESPSDGVVRNVSAMAGQTVPAGAALFEVADLSHLWVRVPVFVGELPEIDADADAAIGGLAARPGAPSRSCKAVAAPPSANAVAGTVDLYYNFVNDAEPIRPGQRVGVSLTLNGDDTALTVPWSAVAIDIHGGTWVYEIVGERAYLRRRVTVRRVVGDTAVLADGPAEGTVVVTAGAAELFGTETGFSK